MFLLDDIAALLSFDDAMRDSIILDFCIIPILRVFL